MNYQDFRLMLFPMICKREPYRAGYGLSKHIISSKTDIPSGCDEILSEPSQILSDANEILSKSTIYYPQLKYRDLSHKQLTP